MEPAEIKAVDRPAVAGFTIFLWAWVAKEALSILNLGVFYLAVSLGPSFESADGSWTVWNLLGVTEIVYAIGTLLAMGVCLYGLLGYARIARQHQVDALIKVALVGCLVSLVWSAFRLLVFDLLPALGAKMGSFGETVGQYGWMLGLAGEAVCLIAVSLAAARVSRGLGRELAGSLVIGLYVMIAIAYLLPLIGYVIRPHVEFLKEYFWIWGALTGGTSLGLLALVITVFTRHRKQLAQVPTPTPPVVEPGPMRFQDEPWPAVRQGLMTYRSGLIAKIIVVVAGFSLLILAGLARAPGAARTVLVIFSVGGMLTTIWMTVGLFGYVRVPVETGGRGAVVVTLVLILIGFSLDLYTLILVGNAFSGRMSALYAMREQIPYVDGIAQVLGILGVMALLFSFRKVAMYAESTTLRSRIGLVAGILIGVAVCSFVVRMLGLEGVIRSAALMPLAIIILAAAIVGLVLYLGILRDLLKDISARD